MKTDYVIFIDFDGTITSRDSGYELFKKFTGGKTEPSVQKYRRGEIDSIQCLSAECDIWNEQPPDQGEVLEFLKGQPITPGFDDFIRSLKENNIDSYILSEGFDFYIDIILNSNGRPDIELISNRAVYEDGLIRPEFPYFNLGCGRCSNCKGYHIRKLSDPRQTAIFIGDGHSDFHGAEASDILFAKSFLKEDLQKNGGYHIDYTDFYDIIKAWKEITKDQVFSFSKRITFYRATLERRGEFEALWENGEVMKFVGYPRGLGRSKEQYDKFWGNLSKRNLILLALENSSGEFMGEAKLAFPDGENTCSHDVKLLPQFRGQGFGREAWLTLIELSQRRWPDAKLSVTPAVENHAAVNLYKSLGFEVEGGPGSWVPTAEDSNAETVHNFEMIKKPII